MEGNRFVDTELDQMLDAAFGSDEEAAEPDEPESAAEADLADGQDEAEAADEGAEEAAESDEAEAGDDDDELSQLRKRLEAVEAERANERAQAQSLAAQRQAAEAEAKLAADEQGWDAYFDQLDEQAWQQAQQTYNPAEAYRQAAKQIEQARKAKTVEYAAYRTGQYQRAYAASQLPAYAKYVADFVGLDGAEAAHIAKLVTTPGFNPDSLPEVARTLKELRAAKVQEQRAEKAATLKKGSKKPGSGRPHTPKVDDLDSYVDAIFA